MRGVARAGETLPLEALGLDGVCSRKRYSEVRTHGCHAATPMESIHVASGSPTLNRSVCLPAFQRGQDSVVLATKQEAQSPFRSFEPAGRAGPRTMT